MMSSKLIVTSFVAIALGCGIEPEAGEFEPEDRELEADAEAEAEDPTVEIVANLRRAGYPAQEIEVGDDGVVIVGGDAVVSLQASREMVGLTAEDHGDDDDHDHFRQYRTTNFIGTGIDTICVNGSAFTGQLSTALDQAIAAYTNLDLTFDLVRTNGQAPGCDALITANLIDGTGGWAGFPANGLPFNSINIGDDILPTFGSDEARHVIMHELGHCIGLRHTDYYNRSISCGGSASNEGDAGVGAIHIPGTPSTAVYDGSIMNSCYHDGSTGQWTATDITALNNMYSANQVPMVPSSLSKMSESCYGFHWAFWKAQPNATSYQLWRSTSSSFSSPVMIYSGPSTNADFNVSSGTWYLRARACNANGCSGWTNQVSATRVNYCM
jgi:hypothetical protein